MTDTVGTIRVLHVDDDPQFADLTATHLGRHDERLGVEHVESAAKGLERLEDRTIDCIVSDYEMPGRTGIEFLETVRESHPGLPFILFTGKGSETVASEAISAGVTDYFQKGTATEQFELLAAKIDSAVRQYRAVQELERKNDLFAKVQNLADVGAWEWYPQRSKGYYSEEVYEIYGVDERTDSTPERDLKEFYHPDDRETLRRAFRRAIERGESYDLKVRITAGDGTEKWVHTTGDPQFEDGECIRIRGSIQDITERIDREETLETLHTAAAEIQACGSVQEATDRTIEAAESVLDLELSSILLHDGDGWLEPVSISSKAPPDGARRVAVDQGLAGKTFQCGTSEFVEEIRPDDDTDPAKETYRSGMSVPIDDHGVFQAVSTEPAAFDEDDVAFAELLVAHTARTIDRIDYEETLQERQSALERQNERLDRFAGIVSHDLRNPLNVASGRVDIAREDHDSEHLDVAAASLDRMEQLVENLLTLARQGNAVSERTSVALESVAEGCWQNVETAGATLRVDTDRSVSADENRLRQLFENLFRNSNEHGGADVTVRVGTTEDGFYVEDDGPGIEPDRRETVFDMEHTTSADGTGLGLQIVHEIVTAHDWEIHVTDGADGGARFEISGVTFTDE